MNILTILMFLAAIYAMGSAGAILRIGGAPLKADANPAFTYIEQLTIMARPLDTANHEFNITKLSDRVTKYMSIYKRHNLPV